MLPGDTSTFPDSIPLHPSYRNLLFYTFPSLFILESLHLHPYSQLITISYFPKNIDVTGREFPHGPVYLPYTLPPPSRYVTHVSLLLCKGNAPCVQHTLCPFAFLRISFHHLVFLFSTGSNPEAWKYTVIFFFFSFLKTLQLQSSLQQLSHLWQYFLRVCLCKFHQDEGLGHWVYCCTSSV